MKLHCYSLGDINDRKYILKERTWFIPSQPEGTGREAPGNNNQTQWQKEALKPLTIVPEQNLAMQLGKQRIVPEEPISVS